MPDPRLPAELEAIADDIPVITTGLPELRYAIQNLPALSPNYLPGVSPALLPESDGTVASSGAAGTGPSAGSTVLAEGPGTIPASMLSPHTLSLLNFAAGTRPVTIVTVLPTLPDANFPIGSQVFLTTDAKLYRNPDDVAWTATISLPDGIGQITGTQIADDAISTPHIAVNSIDASMIQTGQVKAEHMEAYTITAGQIHAGAVTADALASQIILADKLFTTDVPPNQRVEIDDLGVRAYDSANKRVVNIPATGSDPVEVIGKVETGNFLSHSTAELRGTNILAGGSVTTLQVGVQNPATAPTVSTDIPVETTLASVPAQPGIGICRDALGGTGLDTPVFYIGADPTVGNLLDVAYEYRQSDGALLRTIQKTGTTQRITGAVAGSTSHVTDRANGYVGDTDSAFAVAIVMPSDKGVMTITKVSVYMAGRLGTCLTKVALWNSSGTFLSDSAEFTAVDKGDTSVGDSVQYNKALSPAVNVNPGTTVKAGYFRTNDSDGSQHDVNTGSFTTYIGDGNGGDMTGVRTVTTEKPNVFVTYDYDADSSLEGAMTKIIGVARITGSDILWVLDSSGVIYKYTLSTKAYVAKVDHSAYFGGTKANGGLYYDGTNLIICTATGITGTDQVRLVRLNPTTGAWVSTHATSGFAINGSTATVRGGAWGGSYHTVVVNNVVKAYSSSYVYNGAFDWGSASDCDRGLAQSANGNGYGYSSSSPTKVWQYTAFAIGASSNTYHFSYAWYKSTATIRETTRSPLWSGTIGQRRRLIIANPAIPVVSGETPDQVRIYAYNGSSAPALTGSWLQVTDALTSRTRISYTGSGTADQATNGFPAGSAAELKSATAGWTLKGDGTKTGFWRYVPLSSFISVIDAEAYSASDSAIQTSSEITGLPSTGVVAVVCLVILNASSVAGGNYVTLFNYGTTDTEQYAVSCIMAPAVSYNHSIQAIISTGGTNNRQIKYFRNRSAGTVTWYLRIVGYWTTE